ncbi:MAG: endonuclease III [Clostridia bacterium]|nr:endonuclease III [Clostridia bacterium]
MNIILEILAQLYPYTRSELNYENPFQLLVGTILAAQATDRKVNEVTKDLFKEYRTPQDFLKMDLQTLEQKIKSINLYKTKAKHILSTCETLVRKYGGAVPQNREALEELDGVGRKTANVVLSYAFDIPAIAVDTHVFRVANRLGIVQAKNVQETERMMEKLIPREWWSRAHSSLVLHGRRVCDARKPKCDECALKEHCEYERKTEG